MDEKLYRDRTDEAFKGILDLFENVDMEDADIEHAGDVITITFRGKKRVVVNTQRPARQIWLAGGQRAWHFSYDEGGRRWLDDKGTGDELVATIRKLSKEIGGFEL